MLERRTIAGEEAIGGFVDRKNVSREIGKGKEYIYTKEGGKLFSFNFLVFSPTCKSREEFSESYFYFQ